MRQPHASRPAFLRTFAARLLPILALAILLPSLPPAPAHAGPDRKSAGQRLPGPGPEAARAARTPSWPEGIREARNYRAARSPDRIPVLIADCMRSLDSGDAQVLAGASVSPSKDLARFYKRRDYQPAWIVFGRQAVPDAWQLLDAARKSRQDGLDPDEYHVAAIDSLLGAFGRRFGWGVGPAPVKAAQLDLLLTDAYLKLASHLLDGRVSPLSLADQWHLRREKVDLAAYLAKTLDDGGEVRESLRRLAPADPDYAVMKYWLAEYRAIEARGGWPAVPAGRPLGLGDAGDRVRVLCNRLAAQREIGPDDCRDRFDSTLALGLRRFQGRHGLDRSGRMDETTWRALNVPIESRIRQIRLNLEYWRWLPRDLGERHIRVNIADFTLSAWQQGRPALFMRVMVGSKEDSTPVFSDRIVSVLLNPPWNVPESIAGDEILPELQKDPYYLEQQGMELLTSWSEQGEIIQPDTIDWSAVRPEDFRAGNVRFRIRQRAGDGSALGKVKFNLTNPFQVYLHDTPSKAYFSRHRRALTHGCVRVERPLALADWLLRPEWTKETITAEIGKGKASILPVGGEGVPVHILYWTAFTDPMGGLQFRRDIYGWDRKMEADLRERTAGL